MYVPEGFAHGFVVRSEEAIFSYKCTDYYHSDDDMGISFLPFLEKYGYSANDILLSDKDYQYKNLENIEENIYQNDCNNSWFKWATWD